MQKNNFLNKTIKLSHSRMSLSGIFDARSCQIGKTLINKRQLRGRSPITTLGDDGLYVYERQTARGFTLIELLVVVLIIGILAAVALPQYQKAVEKSRVMKVLAIGKALAQAEETYYLANNEYTGILENLDIDIELPPEYSLYLRPDASKIQFNRQGDPYHEIIFILNQATSYPGTIYCYAPAHASKQSIDLCKSWGGEDLTKGQDSSYRYTIQ